ncbi:hypothetical protein Aca07nite_42140 [Actinoplanes capillaceus]|uniref:Uncharacterized protein n=1 Tax=Actinoplanes campanulatus TaxID=113559 RepID=A0ABQ3WL23_9ACTN|nr:hypothetical protein [Actinoplanes capillaceus]GID46939.1 hypothetical protein Aca07nite_42140 [Actinoplanes capillaceus]
MTAVPWRDGAQELRRLVVAENGVPDRIEDVALAWRAFRAFLAVPLDGLFDRWESADAEADTLLVDFGVFHREENLPGLLLVRRFDVPSVEWHDGRPGEPSDDEDDLDLDLADTVQVELELTFASGITAEIYDLWTAARSGEFAAEDLTEAESLVMALSEARPLRSRIDLVNPN